jgi:IMP dehydrogenase
MKRTIRRVLRESRRRTIVVTPDDNAYDASVLMNSADVGALLVIEGGKLAGIVTERDYVRKLVRAGLDPKTTPMRTLMTSNVLYVTPEHTIEACMALMTEKHLRHLPVVDNGHVVGMLSIRDVVEDLLDEKEFLLEQMEHYITDQRPHLVVAAAVGARS